MTDIYAAHAHEYRKKGYSPLPLPAGKKSPPPEGWTGEFAPMASGPDVQYWSEEQPEANIALRLPDGVIGIDIDQYGAKVGADSVRAAIKQFGALPSAGRMSSRVKPSGIRLFRVPAGTKLASTFQAAGLGPDVEIIQHHHRYVVAQPSVHPEGGTYTYLDMAGARTGLPTVGDLPELPQAWIDGLQPKQREPREEIPHDAWDDMDEHTAGRVDTYITNALGATWTELDEMKTWPGDYRGERGGWEESVLAITASLASLVKADWNPLQVEDMVGPLEDHLPHDGGFTLGNGISKFLRAVASDRVDARPFPFEPDFDWWPKDLRVVRPFVEADGSSEPPSAEVVTVEVDADDWPEQPWNEKGDVERTKTWARKGLYWLADERIWVRWAPEEHRWVKDSEGGAKACQRAMHMAERTEILNYDDTPKLNKDGSAEPKSSQQDKFLTHLRNRWGIGQFERVAKSLALSGDVSAESNEFDADGMLLAVKGGAVDLRTGEFITGSMEMKITIESRVVYDPAATAPLFQKYLETSMPDPAMREYLQNIIGYSLIGGNPEQAFFIHWGPQTNNGKTVLMNLLRRILGQQMRAASSKALIRSKNDKHSVEIADLAGPRVLQMGETAEGAHLEEEVVKQVTGKDTIAARKLNQSNQDWIIDGKIHILTNYLPHISASPSMKRRTHLIVWPIEILGQMVDLDLEEKIAAREMSGVLNWAIEGCLRWQKKLTEKAGDSDRKTGLHRPPQARMDMDRYFQEEDQLAEWMNERTHEGSEARSSVLYEDYRTWCFPRGAKPMSATAFGRKLREKKVAKLERSDANYYALGLKLGGGIDSYFK